MIARKIVWVVKDNCHRLHMLTEASILFTNILIQNPF